MSSAATMTTLNIELTLDQVINALSRLNPDARSEVAKALVDVELDERMARLISNLASRPPADDITDADIAFEVETVRMKNRNAC